MSREENTNLKDRLRVKSVDLRKSFEADYFSFDTTNDLHDIKGLIGQDRAVEALCFGTKIEQFGYNVFLLGVPGLGKTDAIRDHLQSFALDKDAPDDWIYVNNFENPQNPIAINLKTGQALAFKKVMKKLIQDLQTLLPATFESEGFRFKQKAINDEIDLNRDKIIEDLRIRAEKDHLALVSTKVGFRLAPISDDGVMTPEDYARLTVAEQKKVEEVIKKYHKEMESLFLSLPEFEKKRLLKMKELNSVTSKKIVFGALEGVRNQFGDIESISNYLDMVEDNLIENFMLFLSSEEESNIIKQALEDPDSNPFNKFRVNVIIGHKNGKRKIHAPVIFEDNPSLSNLVGRIEHSAHYGMLTTDFTQIKPGALHHANGGFLVIDARKLLSNHLAWEALKRALKNERIKIENMQELAGIMSTQSLEPDPIPLNVKIILIGNRYLHNMLSDVDPDFSNLFKVTSDYSGEASYNKRFLNEYSKMIATQVRSKNILPVDSGGIGVIIEEAIRICGDNKKISLNVGFLNNLLSEADFWAREAGKRLITNEEIEKAVEKKRIRLSKLSELNLESIIRNVKLIDTSGAKVGQINGLAVLKIGDVEFGRPSRITARVRPGSGKLVDIEREVELGGPLHSKGVLILSSYISSTFAQKIPLSLWASIVFEQSYNGVDGDSASAAELFALLSAIANVPIYQNIAVTGSINQFGEVQAIGGVNEKIEGFYELCKTRKLSKNHGVIIPNANVTHLMLNKEIKNAVADNKFSIFAIDKVEEGIEILTGMKAGNNLKAGEFEKASLYQKVELRLKEFSEIIKANK